MAERAIEPSENVMSAHVFSASVVKRSLGVEFPSLLNLKLTLKPTTKLVAAENLTSNTIEGFEAGLLGSPPDSSKLF